MAPKIDWAKYKQSVPVAGMVDNFQKHYESLTVPYPADNVSAQVEQQRAQVLKDIEEFKNASNTRIAQQQKELAHLQSLLPYDQMTMEDFADSFPDKALDPINKPTFWPHDKAEQEPRVVPEHH